MSFGHQSHSERRITGAIVAHFKVQRSIGIIILNVQCCPIGIRCHCGTAPTLCSPLCTIIVNFNGLKLQIWRFLYVCRRTAKMWNGYNQQNCSHCCRYHTFPPKSFHLIFAPLFLLIWFSVPLFFYCIIHRFFFQ